MTTGRRKLGIEYPSACIVSISRQDALMHELASHVLHELIRVKVARRARAILRRLSATTTLLAPPDGVQLVPPPTHERADTAKATGPRHDLVMRQREEPHLGRRRLEHRNLLAFGTSHFPRVLHRRLQAGQQPAAQRLGRLAAQLVGVADQVVPAAGRVWVLDWRTM